MKNTLPRNTLSNVETMTLAAINGARKEEQKKNYPAVIHIVFEKCSELKTKLLEESANANKAKTTDALLSREHSSPEQMIDNIIRAQYLVSEYLHDFFGKLKSKEFLEISKQMKKELSPEGRNIKYKKDVFAIVNKSIGRDQSIDELRVSEYFINAFNKNFPKTLDARHGSAERDCIVDGTYAEFRQCISKLSIATDAQESAAHFIKQMALCAAGDKLNYKNRSSGSPKLIGIFSGSSSTSYPASERASISSRKVSTIATLGFARNVASEKEQSRHI